MTEEEYLEELEKIQKSRFSKEDKERLIKELEISYISSRENREHQDIQTLLAKAIIGTMDNHPRDCALGSGMATAISKLYYDHLSNIELAELFCNYISARSMRFNVNLREEVLKYYKENPDSNIILDILSLLEINTNEKDKLRIIQDLVHKILGNNEALEDHIPSIRYLIDLPSFNKHNNLNYIYYGYVFSQFKNRIDMKKLFQDTTRENNDIEVEDITITGKRLLFNSDGIVLIDSYSGTLLNGNIDLASDRGYRSRPSNPQQDAVGSMVIDKNHFINIVADGVGSTDKGHFASLEFVKGILDWYRLLSYDAIDDIEKLSFFLNNIIKGINRKIRQKYGNEAQTTYVIALTVGDKTIISNVGDSTAYTYDEENDELIELTILDSYSYGLSYEEARNNPCNNMVTETIGGSYEVHPHINIIDNNGQTIILSSDGITDLASEETFKSYFRNNSSAKEMVHNAVYNPDQGPFKMEDNVSAIKVTLPNGNVKRRGL